jgi:hypothetical protein
VASARHWCLTPGSRADGPAPQAWRAALRRPATPGPTRAAGPSAGRYRERFATRCQQVDFKGFLPIQEVQRLIKIKKRPKRAVLSANRLQVLDSKGLYTLQSGCPDFRRGLRLALVLVKRVLPSGCPDFRRGLRRQHQGLRDLEESGCPDFRRGLRQVVTHARTELGVRLPRFPKGIETSLPPP